MSVLPYFVTVRFLPIRHTGAAGLASANRRFLLLAEAAVARGVGAEGT
jgi:hypothetical protein